MLHRLAPALRGIKSGLRRHALQGEDGQGLVEYALILVLISIVVIVILSVVGHQVNNVFSNISNGLKH
jgi:pilus assembly protein Flp/PilA